MKYIAEMSIKITLAIILVFSLTSGSLQALATPIESTTGDTDSGGQAHEGQAIATNVPTGHQGQQEQSLLGEIVPLALTHSVQFYTWDGQALGNPVQVVEGEAAVPPAAPDRPGWRFTGWSEDIDHVYTDLEVYAEYVELNSYSITIYYVFADSTIARQPVIYSAEEGSSFSRTVVTPAIPGYSPDKTSVVLDLTNIQDDYAETVTYTPATNTPYTVQHFQQKLILSNPANPRDPANYTLITTQNLTGQTGALVTASAQTYTGFSAPSPLPSAQIAADGTTMLRAYYDRNQYAVYFDSAGGSYVAPMAALFGAPLSAPPAPTRAGYSFDGWSTALPATMPANDITLTAKWKTTGTVNYTLVYYLENIGSTGYDYVGTTTLSATAGAAPVVPSSIPGGITFPIPTNRFSLNSVKTNAELPASVNGNGTTIVNVYYDRNSYTINFQFNATKYTLSVNGTTYTSSPYQLTAKYGASINLRWAGAPTLRNGQSSEGTFIGWEGSSITYVTTQFFLDDNIISNSPLTASWDTNAKNITVVYNFKDLVGNGYTSNYNQTVAIDRNNSTWNAKTFQGFTVQQTPVDIIGNSATFYYDRNQYKITYYNGGSIDRTSTNYYQASISGASFSQAPSSRPASIPTDYTFAGWYTSPQGYDNTKFVFSGATMPANNLILYARWDKPSYTAVFNPDNGTPTFAQTVLALSTITQPTSPTKPGYVFAGWYLPSATLKYTFSFPVTSNLNLTARWIPMNNISYDVVFQKEGVEFQRQTYGGRSVGDTVTANAIPVTGYLPDTLSKSLTLGATSNQIIFNYTPLATTGYTVKFIDSQGGGDLRPPKIVLSTNLASVTENYINISGYYPNYYQQTLMLTPNAAANIITFVYTRNADVNYTVRNMFENLDGSYSIVDEIKQAPAGLRVNELPQTISGYTFMPSLSINDRVVASDGSTIIRMVYNSNFYDITFVTQGSGSLVGSSSFHVKYGSLYGTEVITPTPHADQGYRFVGWEPALPTVATPVTAPATYTAKFEKDPSGWATITFMGNGSTSGTMPPATELLVGSSFQLPGNTFERTNFSYLDWDTEPLGTGNAYADGQTITVSGDLILYAQWVEDSKYAVIYLGNGGTGTLTDANTYYEDDEVTVLTSDFVYPGYRFVNWKDQDGAFFNAGDSFDIEKNTYLTAQWSYDADQWTTLVYDPNTVLYEGTMPEETILTGVSHTLVTNAYTREHHVFTGWNTSPDGSGLSYINGASISPSESGTLTLYAQWSEIPKHTITYIANNGTSETRATTDYEGSGVSILPSDTFNYEHNDFVRWSTNPDGTGITYFSGNTITLTNDITLYAFWMPRSLYTITYKDGFSSDSFSVSDYADALGNLDITVGANPFVRSGYSFDHWLSESNVVAQPGQAIYDIQANMTFTAQWSPVEYTIGYELDGGIVNGINPTRYNTETPTFDIINPTKPGYTFAGWTGTGLDSQTMALAIAQGRWGNLSFTATWEKDPSQWAVVTFMGNGSDAGSMPPSSEMLVGSSYTLPTNVFTRTNYDFVSWDTSETGEGVSYLNGQAITVNESMTLYAQWAGNGEYRVVYLGNGGSGTLTDSEVYQYDDPVEVLSNTFVYPGYALVEWKDQDGSSFAAGQTFSIQENTFLTAQWEVDPEQWTTIVYDSNSSDATGTMNNESVLTGGEHTLSDNMYSREYYVFSGWNTSSDGSGTSYQNSSSITPTTSGTLTLYAQWIEAFYTVTYNDGFCNGSFTETSILTQGQLNIIIADNPFTRPGYTFLHWLSDSAGIFRPAEPLLDLQSSLTFTAQWAPLEYAIDYDLDGGTVATANPSSYTADTPTFSIANPTKPGYTFAGWTGTGLTAQTSSLTVTQGSWGNLSFTAHWVKDPSQWSTITFVNSDPTGGSLSGTLIYEGIQGDPITVGGIPPQIMLLQTNPAIIITYPTAQANNGYIFQGWNQEVPAAFPESDLIITGNWKATNLGAPMATTYDSSSDILLWTGGVAVLSVLLIGLGLFLRKRGRSKS